MINIAEIQKDVFDFLIPYRNDDEQLSLPYLKVDESGYKVCHFLYVKANDEIKVTQEVLYSIQKNTIVRNNQEGKYKLLDKIDLTKKRTCVPKLYDYLNKLFLSDFQLEEIDTMDNETYFAATGEVLNAYLKMAEYFINNFLR